MGSNVKSVEISKEDLTIGNFQKYFEDILITYPAAQIIPVNFFSETHKKNRRHPAPIPSGRRYLHFISFFWWMFF